MHLTRTNQQGSSRLLVMIGLVAVIIILLVAVLVARKSPVNTYSRAAAPAPAQPALQPYDTRLAHPNKTFNLAVQDNKLVSGPSQLTVRQGDSVSVRIKAMGTSEIEAKLDGYDITTESAPEDDTPGGFSFIADKAGSFPFYVLGASSPAQTYYLGTIVVTKP